MTTTTVTTHDVRELVGTLVRRIAPEHAATIATLAGDDLWQEELELDSMDFLALVSALRDAVAVDVPERDYPELVTWAGCLAYVERALVPGHGEADAGR